MMIPVCLCIDNHHHNYDNYYNVYTYYNDCCGAVTAYLRS